MTGEWQSMDTAPHDGTEVYLRILHPNYHRARTDEDRARWQEWVKARWIDHNGGGWTWSGIFGGPVGWKPIKDLP